MIRPSVPKDRESLAAIIEAMIFAGEEPLAPRTLLRLLYEKPKKRKKSAASPEEMVAAAEQEAEAAAAEATEGTTEVTQEQTDASASEGQEADEMLFGKAGQIGQKELREIVDELNDGYEENGRSFRIIEIAGGFQFATTKQFGPFVGLLSRDRAKRRLSPAALETISIVAYRQPVTKPEIESIRGVNCDQVLVSLLERELLTIAGRADTVGRPLLYGTTDAFLRAFGLNSLSDLPKLRELEELMEEDAVAAIRPGAIPPELTEELVEEGPTEGESAQSLMPPVLSTDDAVIEDETTKTVEEASEGEAIALEGIEENE